MDPVEVLPRPAQNLEGDVACPEAWRAMSRLGRKGTFHRARQTP